jgi:hypothetical protein
MHKVNFDPRDAARCLHQAKDHPGALGSLLEILLCLLLYCSWRPVTLHPTGSFRISSSDRVLFQYRVILEGDVVGSQKLEWISMNLCFPHVKFLTVKRVDADSAYLLYKYLLH